MAEIQSFFGTARKLKLPSGAIVLARRPSTISLIASGGFPSELTALVWKHAQGGNDPEELAGDPEMLRKMAEMIDQYVPHVLVSPTVGPVTNIISEGADGVLTGTVHIADMRDEDKRYLFFFGQALAGPLDAGKTEVTPSDLKSFRDESASGDAGHAGEAVRAEAIEPVGAVAVATVGTESGSGDHAAGRPDGTGDGGAGAC